jgi:DedD protein
MSDAPTLQDEDGFHEIQLNGKQLVFLGMTTTLVSVVIFLCGVLVGRGVKPPIEPVAEAASVQTASAQSAPALDPAPPSVTPAATTSAPEAPPPAASAPAATPPAATPPAATPPAVAEAPPPPVETKPVVPAKPQAQARAVAPTPEPSAKETKEEKDAKEATPAPDAAPAPPPAAEAAATPVPARRGAPASGGALAVQVAALTSRADAEVIARRLSGKGYAAYVLDPAPGAKPVFKVRVGNYASAEEAARVSQRLRQEEKLRPWVTR